MSYTFKLACKNNKINKIARQCEKNLLQDTSNHPLLNLNHNSFNHQIFAFGVVGIFQ